MKITEKTHHLVIPDTGEIHIVTPGDDSASMSHELNVVHLSPLGLQVNGYFIPAEDLNRGFQIQTAHAAMRAETWDPETGTPHGSAETDNEHPSEQPPA